MNSRREVALAAAVPAGAVGLLVALQNHWNQYTSDSTAQQSIIRTWLDVGHGITYVPSDTWILKFPVYYATELLPISPGARLLIDVLVLNVVCFGLLGVATWWLARLTWPSLEPRLLPVLAPLVWLAGLGGELSWNKLQPNYRNIELGLAFMAMAIGAAYVDRPHDERPAPERSPFRVPLLGLLLAAGLALLWVDDPYFLVLVGAPFGAACLLWFGLRRRFDIRLLGAITVLVVSLPIYLLIESWLKKLRIVVVGGDNQTSLDLASLRGHVHLLMRALGAQLGLAQSDNEQLVPGTGVGLTPVAAGLTVFVGILAVLAGLAMVVHGWRQRLLLPAFIGLQWLFVLGGFVVSARVDEVAHGRYLILGFYDLAVALAITLPGLAERWPMVARFVVVVLAVSTAANVLVTIQTADAIRNHAWERGETIVSLPTNPVQEKEIQNAIARTGITRGYAQFWSANLMLYRSGGTVSMNSIHCNGQDMVMDDWLTDTARRRAPSGRTFLVYEPYNLNFMICGTPFLRAQFGAPGQIVQAGQAQLWIYDNDIGESIPGTAG